MEPTFPLFRLQNVTSNKDCLRINDLRESFSEDGDGGECLAANPRHTGFWRINSRRPLDDLFIDPGVVPSIPSGELDLIIYFDAAFAFKGYGIASTKERQTAHLFMWNRGLITPRLRPAKPAPYPGLVLPSNTKTIVSGYGDGVIIEIDWLRLQLKLGADDETQYSREWVRDPNWYLWSQLDVPRMLDGHDKVPLCVYGMANGHRIVHRESDDEGGLLYSSPPSGYAQVFVLKHLKMLGPDSRNPTCMSLDLVKLFHNNIVHYEDWCPISRLLARQYIPTDSINYNFFPLPQDVIPLAFDMISALRFLHSARIINDNLGPGHPIVHGNIKPANIFLYAVPAPGQWCFKLTDFGLATESDPRPMRLPDNYIAPEIYNGKRAKDSSWPAHKVYTPQADIWSLGIVLLEMIVKSEASTWYSPKGIYVQRVERKMNAVENSLPAVLSQLLHGMLRPEPNERETAWQLGSMLGQRPDIRKEL